MRHDVKNTFYKTSLQLNLKIKYFLLLQFYSFWLSILNSIQSSNRDRHLNIVKTENTMKKARNQIVTSALICKSGEVWN